MPGCMLKSNTRNEIDKARIAALAATHLVLRTPTSLDTITENVNGSAGASTDTSWSASCAR